MITLIQPTERYLKGDPGDSAYDVAVANGFEGTEQEWLDSLKGEPGTDGYTPQKGVDYFDGEPGEKGEKGDSYILTEADKEDITQRMLNELEQAEDFTYGG